MTWVGSSLLQLYKSLNHRQTAFLARNIWKIPLLKAIKVYLWWQMNKLDYAQEPIKAMPSFKQMWMLEMAFKTTPDT
jgi:hypothetical protein